MESAKLDEEKLREAACYGDLDAVKTLIMKGVNVNAQHSINGWLVSFSMIHSNFLTIYCNLFRTALHWAAKRNHMDVALFLVTNGADKNLESFAKEIPADLSSSPAVLNLLGSTKVRIPKEEAESSSIIPSYLAQSNIGYKINLQEHSNQSSPVKLREQPRG